MGYYFEGTNAFGRRTGVGTGRILRRRSGAVRVQELENGGIKLSFGVTCDARINPETNKREYLNINVAVYDWKVSQQIFKFAMNLKQGETVHFEGAIWTFIPQLGDSDGAYNEVQAEILAYPEDYLPKTEDTEVTKTPSGKRRVLKVKKSDVAPVEKYGFR